MSEDIRPEPVKPRDPWEGEGCPIVADMLVQHWRDRTRPAVLKAVRGFGSTSVDVLKSLNLHNVGSGQQRGCARVVAEARAEGW